MSTKSTRYDTKSAAVYLGVVKNTVSNWRHLCRGPVYYKVGDRVYYYEEDLDRFIKSGRIDPNER